MSCDGIKSILHTSRCEHWCRFCCCQIQTLTDPLGPLPASTSLQASSTTLNTQVYICAINQIFKALVKLCFLPNCCTSHCGLKLLLSNRIQTSTCSLMGVKSSWLFCLLSQHWFNHYVLSVNHAAVLLQLKHTIMTPLSPHKETFLLLNNLVFLGHLQVSLIWLQLSIPLLSSLSPLLAISLTVISPLVYSSPPPPPVPLEPVGLALRSPIR